MTANALNQTSKTKVPAAQTSVGNNLLETEKNLGKGQIPNNNNPFAEALAKSGGFKNLDGQGQTPDAQALYQQQKEMERLKKKQAKERLHKEINPIEARAVFDAKQRKTEQEIEQIRQELKMLAIEVVKFEKEIDLTLTKEIVQPGTEGSYFKNFLAQLRAFIILMRQKVRSARTWAQQLNGKKKKKHNKMPGLEIKGSRLEKTSMVQEMINNNEGNVGLGAG